MHNVAAARQAADANAVRDAARPSPEEPHQRDLAVTRERSMVIRNNVTTDPQQRTALHQILPSNAT